MDPLSLFRNLTAQLKPFARPLFLCSSLFTVLLGLFIWQYITHPEWYGAYEEGDTANGDIDLSSLTPEEQARLANIDNLSVLQNDLGEDGSPLNLNGQENLSLLQALLASTPGEGTSGRGDGAPLAKYLENYRFLGGNSGGNASNVNIYSGLFNSDGTNGGGLGQGLLGSQGTNPTGETTTGDQRPISALEAALRRNQTEAEAANRNEGEAVAEASTNPGNGLPNPVTLPGVGTFLPTTDIMSPPPGTTGYTPPASLQSPSPTATTPTGLSPLPGIGGVSGSSNLDLTPNANVGGGTVLPSNTAPIGSALTTPALPSGTSPYTVPRPPGSYIGGGYINTFSNPSGPPSN